MLSSGCCNEVGKYSENGHGNMNKYADIGIALGSIAITSSAGGPSLGRDPGAMQGREGVERLSPLQHRSYLGKRRDVSSHQWHYEVQS